MSETRGWAWENDPMYAAGACRVACRMLRPPEEDGREAFSHAQSERGLPTRSDRASRIKPTKNFRGLRMRAGGQYITENECQFGQREAGLKEGCLHLSILQITKVGNNGPNLVYKVCYG